MWNEAGAQHTTGDIGAKHRACAFEVRPLSLDIQNGTAAAYLSYHQVLRGAGDVGHS